MQKWENFDPDYNLYAQSKTIAWEYTQQRPYKGDPAHEKSYAKYFEVTSTPKRGRVVKPKQEAIDAAASNFGYFALLSNEIKDVAAHFP